MKIEIKHLGYQLLGIVLALSLVVGPYSLWAQSTGTSGNQQPTAPSPVANKTTSDGKKFVDIDNDCRKALKPYIAKKEKDFREFMQKTFTNKSDTSVLLDVAFRKYKQFRQDIQEFALQRTPTPGTFLDQALIQQTACNKLVGDALNTAEAVMKKHILKNAQGKKTTKLVTKFRDLNKKLSTMHREMVFLRGFMESFDSKVNCFVKKCIK